MGDPIPEDWEKARRLANHSKLPVYVICSQPECREIWDNWYQNESSATLVLADSEDGSKCGDNHYLLVRMPSLPQMRATI